MELRFQPPDQQVINVQTRIIEIGYGEDVTITGYFDKALEEAVELFQAQHIGPNGLQLKRDGVVGDKTLWALRNPSGKAQRNHIIVNIDRHGITEDRLDVLDWCFSQHAKGVHEVPDGSNRSDEIDTYWGNTGVIGKAWCCAFVSTALKLALGYYPITGKHHLGVQKMFRAARQVGLVVTDPLPGNVFIQIKPSGKGHTGIIAGLSADGTRVVTVEGNCGNRVKVGCRFLGDLDYIIDPYSDDQTMDFGRIDTAHLPALGGDGTR